MYFNVFCRDTNLFVKNYSYEPIDMSQNYTPVELVVLMERTYNNFSEEYDTNKYYLCVSFSDKEKNK